MLFYFSVTTLKASKYRKHNADKHTTRDTQGSRKEKTELCQLTSVDKETVSRSSELRRPRCPSAYRDRTLDDNDRVVVIDTGVRHAHGDALHGQFVSKELPPRRTPSADDGDSEQ